MTFAILMAVVILAVAQGLGIYELPLWVFVVFGILMALDVYLDR